ncbi:CG43294, partial [Drosophila busckii]
LTSETTYAAYSADCNRYYETRLVKCPQNLYWHAQLQSCVQQQQSECLGISSHQTTSTVVEQALDLESLCKAQSAVFIPYPGDCSRFIQCDYLPFVKTCPQYLYWNSKLLTCDKICV